MPAAVGDGVPDDEISGIDGWVGVDKHAPMAAVEDLPCFAEQPPPRGEGGGGGGGDGSVVAGVAEVAEHGRPPVELAVAAVEGGVREHAPPGLADDGGAEEARRVVHGSGGVRGGAMARYLALVFFFFGARG